MPRFRKRLSGNFQSNYASYARDHGMTPEQMRDLDRNLYPYTMLTPFFSGSAKRSSNGLD